MTENLHAKFGALETQIAADHTELMAALNSIGYALGAPPTAPTVTLADVVEALNISNLLLATANTNTAGIRTDLSSVNQLLDTMNNNASTNTQALIKALYATFCGCTTTAPLLPPPLDVTPTTIIDDAKCRRIQFYLSVFSNWLGKIANYAGATGFVTGDAIGTLLGLAATEAAITATGAEVGVVGGPPGVIIGAIVGLITGAIFIFGSAVVSDYATQFINPTLQHSLLLALYAATNADEGQAAFESVIADNFATVPGAIINALWWTAWSNDIYSGVPIVDDSAFDGSLCAPSGEVVNTLNCMIDASYSNVDGYTWHLMYCGHHDFPNNTGPGLYLPYAPIVADVVVVEVKNFTSKTNGYSTYIFSDENGALNTGGVHINGYSTTEFYLYFGGNNQQTHIYHYPQGDDNETANADFCVWALRSA